MEETKSLLEVIQKVQPEVLIGALIELSSFCCQYFLSSFLFSTSLTYVHCLEIL